MSENHNSAQSPKPESQKILIQGVTEEGQTFRPSDWAERMSANLSTFQGQRMVYSPLLQPIVRDGEKCMLIAPELKEKNPALYDAIMEFAHSNKLIICSEKE